jgi:hypothetical protein
VKAICFELINMRHELVQLASKASKVVIGNTNLADRAKRAISTACRLQFAERTQFARIGSHDQIAMSTQKAARESRHAEMADLHMRAGCAVTAI